MMHDMDLISYFSLTLLIIEAMNRLCFWLDNVYDEGKSCAKAVLHKISNDTLEQ